VITENDKIYNCYLDFKIQWSIPSHKFLRKFSSNNHVKWSKMYPDHKMLAGCRQTGRRFDQKISGLIITDVSVRCCSAVIESINILQINWQQKLSRTCWQNLIADWEPESWHNLTAGWQQKSSKSCIKF